MGKLNRKLNLNVLSDERTEEIRESHVSSSMGEMKKSIKKLDLQVESAPSARQAVVVTPRYQGTDLADIARDVYHENVKPRVEKERIEYADCGPNTHARRVGERSIQNAIMGLRNGGNEGKLSQVGPNGSGNVGKYSPSADQGSGNATNNGNNYYALTTDMTLEEYEEYIAQKFMNEGIRDHDPEGGTKERKARLEKKRGHKVDDHPEYLETDMKKRQENNEKARKEMEKVPGQKNPHFEQAVLDVKYKLLEMEDHSWQAIDKVMRKIAKDNFMTPKELHKEFKANNNGQIPDEWIKEHREVEMAGFVPLQELARLNPVGNIYNVTYMYRGGTQRQKFLVPHPEKPSQEEMEEYVRGFWPFARVMAYYPDPIDNEQNTNDLVAVPPVTENYYFYSPEDWTTLSEEEIEIYNHICEEEGEPISAPEQQEDGTYLLLVSDHDTGENKYITFGEAMSKDEWEEKLKAAAAANQKRDKERGMKIHDTEGVKDMFKIGSKKKEVKEEKDKPGKGSGSKDACYHKVKSRYSVWPSAYASGALTKCRQKGADNWGKSDKKEEYEPINEMGRNEKALSQWNSSMSDITKKSNSRIQSGLNRRAKTQPVHEDSAAYNAKDPQKNPFRNKTPKKPQDVSKAGKFQDTAKVVRQFTRNVGDFGSAKKAPLFTAMNTSSSYQPPTQGMKGRA
jgi:hypothetical protein